MIKDFDERCSQIQAAVKDPVFPDYTVNALDLGARGDDETDNTEIFNKALVDISNKGGGTLFIPTGIWKTGPIQLQSNVRIHTERGTIILFERDFLKYPINQVDSRHRRIQPVSGIGLKNVAITGLGIFDASGDTWHSNKIAKIFPILLDIMKNKGYVDDGKGYIWPPKVNREKEERPYMIELFDCENVLFEGITIQNAPMFALVPHGCNNLHINGVKVLGEQWAQNGDAIDISGGTNILVENCTISAGDDGICMKAGGGPGEEAKLQNVLVQDCTVYHAHGGFVIGSNTDGGANNIYCRRCNFMYTDTGIRMKSGRGRGGLIHNVYLKDIQMKDIHYQAITLSSLYEDVNAFGNNSKKDDKAKWVPEYTDIHISDIVCDGALEDIQLVGLEEKPIHHIYLDNILIRSEGKGEISNAHDIIQNNVRCIHAKTCDVLN